MIILAHRGFWLERGEKNTRGAFVRAFENGYGIETDVRDQNGELVIAHDLPVGDGLMTFAELLDLYTAHGAPGALAINIKADGLQAPLVSQLKAAGVSNAFVFDMSVPDGLKYLQTDVAAYTRESEYEREPSFYEQAAGVWMDCFKSDWIDTAAIARHVEAGKAVALVSPELHGRPYEATWASWAAARDLPGVMICTDLPDDARKLLGRAT